MTLDEAKALMSQEALEKLKDVTTVEPDIKISPKINNDILMTALCNAVTKDVIHKTSLDMRTVKLLSSNTNSLQEQKFTDITRVVRVKQPELICRISLMTKDLNEIIQRWYFDGTAKDPKFIEIFEYVIKRFQITPGDVRTKLGAVLKLSIVNNIAQLVAKYLNSPEEERSQLRVSINTITRLVNMEEYIIIAEYIEQK